jgi:F-box protein 9
VHGIALKPIKVAEIGAIPPDGLEHCQSSLPRSTWNSPISASIYALATMENPDSALEQFRRQWKEEVNARAKHGQIRQSKDYDTAQAGPSRSSEAPKPWVPPPQYQPAQNMPEDEKSHRFEEEERSGLANRLDRLALSNADDDEFSRTTLKEPESALEHYERAVKKESQGNLGESLSHYRKAYRLDARVDQSYKHKHFPPTSKPGNLNPSNAPVTVPSTAHHSSKDPTESTSTNGLIESFAGLPILGAAAIIEGDRPPPCPISHLPFEILFEILMSTAILDPASFARLAMVCKRLAYHVFVETQIWKRVALGPEFGLASQVYSFKTDLQGREAVNRALHICEGPTSIHDTAFVDPSNEDWREVFHSHPRIRFTGVYISTVNYTRAGGASATQATWGTPVHIVTYYRYLRFFRDGTVISLQSTNEPVEVVHHLTKENVALVRGGKEHHPLNFTSSAPATNPPPFQSGPPTAHHLMKPALRGRWRLCPPLAAEPEPAADIVTAGIGTEDDLYIETEGAGPRYLYTMQLALRSSTKSKHGVKNNKLQWKGFWSYNQLTNDWAPFQMKNDRAFFFSRVRSYGLGY